MNESNGFTMVRGKLNRRSIVKKGAVLLGAGFIGSTVEVAAKPNRNKEDNLFNVVYFGATGNRGENATTPIREALDACASAGGGTVYIPPGSYTVGTLQIRDNVSLHIEAGATLFLSQDPQDFIPGARTMIYAEDAENISVIGRGTLDGLANYEFTDMRGVDPEIADEIEIAREAGEDMRRYYRTGMQTFMFVLNNCTNILLRDISVINSPLWNIRFNDCNRVFVRGIYIFSDLEKGVNADGIDICSTSNVTISDSVIVTGDDSIVLKTPLRQGQEKASPAENIVVTNCVLTSSSTPLMIGTETHADIRHVIFSNCTIRNSNKGFGINVQDGATVSDVLFSNLTIETSRRHWNWWGSAELCKFILKKRGENSRLGKIQEIFIENIISQIRGTSVLKGHPEQPLEHIRMENIKINMKPENYISKRTTHAMQIMNIKGLKIRDLSVEWTEDQTEKKWGSALFLEDSSEVEIVSFSGRQGLKEGNTPAIMLVNVHDVLIRDSSAIPGCADFIHVKGEKIRDITLRNNNAKKAKGYITFEDEKLKNAVEING
jgi:hypothetical protein